MTRFPHDKIVLVTRLTPLEELVHRFGTAEQARFYIEQSGASFDAYRFFHEAYRAAFQKLRESLPPAVRTQTIDRGFLPNFQFGPRDLVVTLGPDGLIVNTAKYLHGQPILAFNPDPTRIDGVLIPFQVESARLAFESVREGRVRTRPITMACAQLNDGQTLHAVNDLFIGSRTHVSARYRLAHREFVEDHSSSGIIVSTGAGSTGWLRSVLTGASAVVAAYADSRQVRAVREAYAFGWEERRLAFSVREPFVSKTSTAELVFGWIDEHSPLKITSMMPLNGVIFSDGVEEDFLQFNSGAVARIGLSQRTLSLVVPKPSNPRSMWASADHGGSDAPSR